jgi:hypothetical protein
MEQPQSCWQQNNNLDQPVPSFDLLADISDLASEDRPHPYTQAAEIEDD